MNYNCHDIFMMRVPSLPLNIYPIIEKMDKNNAMDIITQNYNLYSFLAKSLPISSKSLYHSFLNPPHENKKKKHLNSALINYLKRACTRTTPYGLMSGVALARFSDNTQLKINNKEYNEDIQVDYHWLNNVIYNLEKNPELIKQLRIKFNSSCYTWGNRMKNPHYTNHGTLYKIEKHVEENDIQYTDLVKIIQKVNFFIPYSELKDRINIAYPGVPDKLLEETLKKLIENEYLLTELRIPAYCSNPLLHVIHVLEGKNNIEKALSQLKKILKDINDYKNAPQKEEEIKILYSDMENLFNGKDYIQINKGVICKESTLDYSIKLYLERFVECMDYIALERKEYSVLNIFREALLEKYGLNVEVPLIDIIDPNGFNGISLVEAYNNDMSERESEIKHIMDSKILKAIENGNSEVLICRKDFDKLLPSDKFSKKAISFDLNCFITISKEGTPYIQVGPNAGAFKAGNMFQRFSDAVDPELMEQYNKIYLKEEEVIDGEYILVEAREAPIAGRVNNIINRHKNHKYYLTMGCTDTDSDDNKISIHDLCIGVSEGRYLYIKSISKNKKCKVIVDNMVVAEANNKILRFLRDISSEYEDNIIKRCFRIFQNHYIHIPTIKIEEVVIYPGCWKFSRQELETNSFELFQLCYSSAIEEYRIDPFVYLCEGDKRLIISNNNLNDIEVLYNSYKKNSEIFLCRLEENIWNGNITQDQFMQAYNTEFVFSFFLNKNKKIANKYEDMELGKQLCKVNDSFRLGKDGWVYMKVYGIGAKEDRFISKYLPSALEQLKFQKFFFLRYADRGKHIRIRFKFIDEINAYQELRIINIWLDNMIKDGLVNRVDFDTYEREINRYGGINMIDLAEDVFYADSLYVMSILSQFDMKNEDDRDMVYITGICSAFFGLTNNLKEIFDLLDEGKNKTSLMTEFQRKRKSYINIINSVANNEPEKIDKRFYNSKKYYQNREKVLINFRNILKEELEREKRLKHKKDIIYSIVHMFCNRVLGDTMQEAKYLAILRHALHAYLAQEEHHTI